MTKELAEREDSYFKFLGSIKEQINTARIEAARIINKELISLYWQIGKKIVSSQKKHGWGKAFVEQLSLDLKKAFPGMSGFSSQNLWYMRQLFMEYKGDKNLQQLVGEISWSHNIIIMSKIKDKKGRLYYLQAVVEMGWTRNVLLNQIKGNAYERHLTDKLHNFDKALPVHLAEQADATLKDSYMLDFLGIAKPVLEIELERRMIEKIREVLLELGYGFSFIGSQYPILVENKEYFIDLLFYNRKLKSLVAIELKTGKFKPEYAGKLNFYLNLLDDFVREKGENPSIGIIMCAERDHFEVEYALRGIEKPIGVSEYHLTKILPKALAGKLPDIKKLTETITRELEN